jgi:hypothetical protein
MSEELCQAVDSGEGEGGRVLLWYACGRASYYQVFGNRFDPITSRSFSSPPPPFRKIFFTLDSIYQNVICFTH